MAQSRTIGTDEKTKERKKKVKGLRFRKDKAEQEFPGGKLNYGKVFLFMGRD